MGGQQTIKTGVLIVGGSLGAVAAAISCGRLGIQTVLVSPDTWLGGQVTSQGVPTDEHPWIDSTGSTSTYREYRNRVRNYYFHNLPLDNRWRLEPRLNPGGGMVSPITHDPRVSRLVLLEMLLPYQISGTLRILPGCEAKSVDKVGSRVRAVNFGDFVVEADQTIDATETGELLPLSGTEYSLGAEGRAAFQEPHGSDEANSRNQQAVSWCAVLGWDSDSDSAKNREPVQKPRTYDHWKTTKAPFWPGPQLSFHSIEPFTGKAATGSLFGGCQPGADKVGGYWAYRRIHRPDLYSNDRPRLDATVLNWPQIDYWEAPVIDESDAPNNLVRAKELSLSFIHWLQTEAPREDGSGKSGYPEIFLRTDVFDTPDGLAREVYIRESRRIKALKTVTELDVGVQARKDFYGDNEQAKRAAWFADSVGLASYRIDLHPSTGGDSYIDIESYPAQIPLGAFIPRETDGLIPGCKNIGTTHLSSGMYRVHPSEWNIGEAAGALACFVIQRSITPRALAESPKMTGEFQDLLHDTLGFELEWPPHVATIPRYVPQFQWIVKEKRKGWGLG